MKEVIKHQDISLEHSLIHQFNSSLPREVNIYNQAFLILDRPIVKAQRIHQPTDHEIVLQFIVTGELEGSFTCLLDTYKKDITSAEKNTFLSLYTESMNILLGRFLSNLDDEFDILSALSAPSNLSKERYTQYLTQSSESEKYSFGYTLISNFKEYDCRIIFNRKINSGALNV